MNIVLYYSLHFMTSFYMAVSDVKAEVDRTPILCKTLSKVKSVAGGIFGYIIDYFMMI